MTVWNEDEDVDTGSVLAVPLKSTMIGAAPGVTAMGICALICHRPAQPGARPVNGIQLELTLPEVPTSPGWLAQFTGAAAPSLIRQVPMSTSVSVFGTVTKGDDGAPTPSAGSPGMTPWPVA